MATAITAPTNSLGPSVSDLITNRHSKRWYQREKPVPLSILRKVLEAARNAPSSRNTQQWGILCVSGEARDELSEALCRRVDLDEEQQRDPLKPRNVEVMTGRAKELMGKWGKGLFQVKGIDRQDKIARKKNRRQNFEFWNAPVELIYHLPKKSSRGTFLELGLLMQNVMLGFLAYGINTCPMFSIGQMPHVIREYYPQLEDRWIVVGMSVGYMDLENPVNSYIPERLELEEYTEWFGWTVDEMNEASNTKPSKSIKKVDEKVLGGSVESEVEDVVLLGEIESKSQVDDSHKCDANCSCGGGGGGEGRGELTLVNDTSNGGDHSNGVVKNGFGKEVKRDERKITPWTEKYLREKESPKSQQQIENVLDEKPKEEQKVSTEAVDQSKTENKMKHCSNGIVLPQKMVSIAQAVQTVSCTMKSECQTLEQMQKDIDERQRRLNGAKSGLQLVRGFVKEFLGNERCSFSIPNDGSADFEVLSKTVAKYGYRAEQTEEPPLFTIRY